ncbi:MAG: hypothetical protein OEV44_04600 [Spirochaetota bacterium]|nr:hypothetical protein [Spirochaetota bacterium]
MNINLFKKLLIGISILSIFYSITNCGRNKSASYYYIALQYYLLVSQRKIPADKENEKKIISYLSKSLEENKDNLEAIKLKIFVQAGYFDIINKNILNNISLIDPERILQYFIELVEGDPNNISMRKFLINYFENATNYYPNNYMFHNSLAWYYATSKNKDLHNPQLALKHAKIAVELSKWKNDVYLDTLAEAYFVNNNLQKAIEIETQAIALSKSIYNKQLFNSNLKRYKAALENQKSVK